MAIMFHAKSCVDRWMVTLSFGIQTSEPPLAWRMTENAGPDRVNFYLPEIWFFQNCGAYFISQFTMKDVFQKTVSKARFDRL